MSMSSFTELVCFHFAMICVALLVTAFSPSLSSSSKALKVKQEDGVEKVTKR